MSLYDGEPELAKQIAIAYEILSVSREHVHEIFDEAPLEVIIQSVERTQVDLREHIRRSHPGERPPVSTARFLGNALGKLAGTRSDPEPRSNPEGVEMRGILVDGLVRAASAYWSHVTDGHPEPKGSAEDYVISLPRRPESPRRWWRRR